MADMGNIATGEIRVSQNAPDFSAPWEVVSSYIPSKDEVLSSPAEHRNISAGVAAIKTAAEISLYRNQPEVLEKIKKEKMDAIDTKTESLIAQGFLHNSLIFSLSSNAQLKWTGLRLALITGDIKPSDFPLDVPTKDDDACYEILDKFEAETMYQVAVGTVQTHIGGGQALKNAVLAALTAEEVDAIVDNR